MKVNVSIDNGNVIGSHVKMAYKVSEEEDNLREMLKAVRRVYGHAKHANEITLKELETLIAIGEGHSKEELLRRLGALHKKVTNTLTEW